MVSHELKTGLSVIKWEKREKKREKKTRGERKRIKGKGGGRDYLSLD